VVLLHGLASSFDHNWREPGWVDLLTESGRDVLALDLPGHGIGPHETDPAAYANVPAQVANRIDRAAGPGAQVDAVGFSLGGQTLLAIAAAQPEQFRRLAILGVGDAVIAPSSVPRSLDLAEVFVSAQEPEPGVGQLFWRLARSAGNDPVALAAFVQRPPYAFDASGLARITCPVLVVIGDEDFGGPADGLVAALPQARSVVLRGTDHFTTTSDYRCMDAVLSFLDE
jgi:pimeloyl-ACP methyl ester carboxylesterase